jgi:hypothetical protein
MLVFEASHRPHPDDAKTADSSGLCYFRDTAAALGMDLGALRVQQVLYDALCVHG